MSDYKGSGKFLLQMKEKQEQALKDWCTANSVAYITANCEGRAKLEWQYADFLKKRALEDLLERQRLLELEKQEKQKHLAEEFERALPPRYKGANITDFHTSEKQQAILNGASALILGDNSKGKTRYAWALAREWVNRGETWKIIKAQALLANLKGQDDTYASIRKNWVVNVQHLVIDEIDKIFESRADFIYLNYLIDERYEWMLQTIVIGNGTEQSFIASLGQSIFSRIAGDGGLSVEFSGKDKRFNEHEVKAWQK